VGNTVSIFWIELLAQVGLVDTVFRVRHLRRKVWATIGQPAQKCDFLCNNIYAPPYVYTLGDVKDVSGRVVSQKSMRAICGMQYLMQVAGDCETN
jgi:hypothetical protein